jgi:predicted SAM-dependent methyltransferase
MEKLNYLNVGCGGKYHKQWVNVDMVSKTTDIIAYNLLKGIPFSDNYFEVVYHSQVLEHFPKEKAIHFIKECYRVLKPGGIIRVVVPDLENIVNEYKKYLDENLNAPNELSEANYEWILLELYDQSVRNYEGGQMAEYLRRPDVVNENYIKERIGYIGHNIRDSHLKGSTVNYVEMFKKAFSSFGMIKKSVAYVLRIIYAKAFPKTKAKKIGTFRLGGEIHMWMYDRYSLSKLLRDCGFVNISVKNPFESNIPDWDKYELDVKDNMVFDPTSLFIEARKA